MADERPWQHYSKAETDVRRRTDSGPLSGAFEQVSGTFGPNWMRYLRVLVSSQSQRDKRVL
jgi:hypothetical protein